MFNQFAIIFDEQWQMYTLAMMFGIILSLAWMVYRAPTGQRTRTLDVCLSALIGAVLVGRLLHVWLNWAFFVDRIDLIHQPGREGGLNWQGALIGALLAGYLMARLRRVSMSNLLVNAVLVLPLLALLGWYGCATAGCAYGAPVERMADYPAWLVWAADDIYRLNMPRFATQAISMVFSLGLLLIALILHWRAWLLQSRFWWMVVLLSMSDFVIAFLRGDYAIEWFSLRVDQWLDIALVVIAGIAIVWVQRTTPTNCHSD